MEWWDLRDREHDGGVLELESPALELHVYERDGARHAVWLNDDGSEWWRVVPGEA